MSDFDFNSMTLEGLVHLALDLGVDVTDGPPEEMLRLRIKRFSL